MISLLHDQNWNTPFSGALCSGGSRPWGKGGGGGGVSVCLSHVGLGFRPKLGEGGRAPSLNPPLLCKHMCPRTACLIIFLLLCCSCVLFCHRFVRFLCGSAIMQRKVTHVSFFRFFLPYLREHSCVEIQKFCYHGNMTQRLILSIAVLFNNHCWVILDRNALAAD